jgi:hypothetical protein
VGLDYARDKMSRLVNALAADIRPLPERLERVSFPLTSALEDAERGGYLSDDLLTRMQDVKYRLARIGASDNEAVEAHEIVSELVDLTGRISSLEEDAAG